MCMRIELSVKQCLNSIITCAFLFGCDWCLSGWSLNWHDFLGHGAHASFNLRREAETRLDPCMVVSTQICG